MPTYTLIFYLILITCTVSKVNISICLNDFTSKSPVYKWFSSQLWSFGIIPKNYNPNPVDINNIITKDNMHIIIQIHANIETQQRGNEPPSKDIINLYLNSTNETEYIHWEAYIEDDSSGVAFPQDLLLTMAETQSFNQRSYIIAYNKWMQYLQSTNSIIQLINNNIMIYAQSGFASSSHSLLSPDLGNSDCIILERANDDIGDLQTGIAFARGAAKQYKKLWGIDLSLWWGVIYGTIQNLASQSYRKRHLYISYFSGAEIINIEGGDLLFNNNGVPSNLVPVIEQFGNFTMKYPDLSNNKVDIPIAILLSKDNGYITPQYWNTNMFAWNYAHIEPRIGDDNIGAFFSVAFPSSNFYQDPFPLGKYESNTPPASSFALSCITPKYAPDGNTAEFEYYAPCYIPFGEYYNRTDAKSSFINNKIDPSPYRSMGDSRWGDIFDVFVLDSYLIQNKNNILSQYPVLLLLGALNITNQDFSYNLLYDYVVNGGILLWSVGVAKPEHYTLIGMNITSNLLVGRYWKWNDETQIIQESFRYVPVNSVNNKNQNVSIIAEIPTHQNGVSRPLIISHKIGKGNVYTVLVPWCSGALPYQLSKLCTKLFDNIISNKYQEIKIDDTSSSSFNSLQFLSSFDDKNRNVLISNNDENEWFGNILIKNVPTNITICNELLSQQKQSFSRLQESITTINISLNIAKYDIIIIQCSM